MSATRSTSSCTFTFSDGRRCRGLRQPGHPLFCSNHARLHDRAGAAETLGREFAHFFSRRYLSACDLNAALGSLFTATIRGHVPPKTTRTLAYLAQVMVQCIRLTEHEYAETSGGDGWRRAVHNSINSNFDYRSPAPPAFQTVQAPARVEAGLQPGSSSNAPSVAPPPTARPAVSASRPASVEAGLQPGSSFNSPSITPPPTVRPAESPQPSPSVPPPHTEKPALNGASLASAPLTSTMVTLQPAPLQPALTLNLPAPSGAPASLGAVSSAMDASSNRSASASVALGLKSQLKHLLVSELSQRAAPGQTSSQPLQSAPKVTAKPTNVEPQGNGEEQMDGAEEMAEEEEMPGEEEVDDDRDECYSGARVPALRRRLWRERV